MPNTLTHYTAPKLPMFDLEKKDIQFIFSSKEYRDTLINLIRNATQRICITALYWQNDEAGQSILDEVILAKQHHPDLKVDVFVDFHRAQRGRLGEDKSQTNAQWYWQELVKHGLDQDPNINFYGVPVNTREVFGVLHIKGFIIDDNVLYSGASINDVYLHQGERYRYDRYHVIHNQSLANCMHQFMSQYILSDTVQRLDDTVVNDKSIRQSIRQYRKTLASKAQYSDAQHLPNKDYYNNQLTVTPIFGIGAHNVLNHSIESLLSMVEERVVICTPYFNLPRPLKRQLGKLLKSGKSIEIIVGDKTANDFYTPPEEKFHLSSALPYLYEVNLRKFCLRFKKYIDQNILKIRIWKDGQNSYHLKGVWIDNEYMLLTGNNLNPRAWRLDAENALLLHDPKHELEHQSHYELEQIRTHTQLIKNYQQLENHDTYPQEVRKVLTRFKRLQADRIVKLIL